VSQLIDRERESGTASPSKRSRPNSIYNTANVTPQNENDGARPQMQSASTQTLAAAGTATVFEEPPPSTSLPPKREYITYSKGIQTEDTADAGIETDAERENDLPVRSRRNTRRETERDEEIRARLRKEIEEEIRATQSGNLTDTSTPAAQQRLPLRPLTSTEVNAVTASDDFVSFLERSTKVIERALDEDYDLLADYTRTAALNDSDDDDSPYSRTSKKSHSLREVHQLYSERHTRRRMISDLQFSPHFPELLLSSHTKNSSAPNEPHGLVLLWNTKSPSRAEYVFTAPTDVLTARFSPFHPNLVIGGCYSGQVCLWDTRVSGRTGAAVQRTPQSGSHLGQTHPIYSMSIVGTPNAHNIITTSTDGVLCSWSVDMFTQPQEYLELTSPPPAKTEDIAPTAMAFPTADPTFFLVGTEEGSIYPCHRYDRAGAKAGVDSRLVYRGHTAPVMSAQFHPARGPVDLGDLMLTSSTDWSVKLWRVKPAASSSSSNMAGGPQKIDPILDIQREDLVYDAKWAPHRPGIFACTTGAGEVEVFDLNYDTEVPVVKASPTRGTRELVDKGFRGFHGLNKVAWEDTRGKMIATGGLDGVVTVFEVGKGLSGAFGDAGPDEWFDVKRLVGRLEGGKS
jgi:dynein intermediate chain